MEAELTLESGELAGRVTTVRAGKEVRVGSGPEATLRLAEAAPAQLALQVAGEALRVIALAPGTLLNGSPLPPGAHGLQTDDVLSFAGCALRVALIGDDGRPLPPPKRTRPALPTLPGLRLDRLLGEGATGRVYGGVRAQDARPVAVKVLKEGLQPGSSDHERFLREARIGAKLRDPAIVEILDLQVQREATWIVMEWVEGLSADRLIRERGPLPVGDALRIAEDVARALAVAAAQGVVHRDVKPANVIVTPTGGAKLADFGIAKDLQAAIRTLTQSGQGLGTLSYLPPEQLAGAKHVDPRADLYGLGATLYHLLAGRPPFLAGSVHELFAAVERAPLPLTTLRPDCPSEVTQLVEALLAKDPFERPPNARRVGRRLRALRSG